MEERLPVSESRDYHPEHSPDRTPLLSGRHGRGRTIVLLALTLLAGLVGGLLAPSFERSFGRFLPFGRQGTAGNSTKEEQSVKVVTEENAVADLVETNSPSVVSIVISKDVPKVRSFSGTPFGGFPFFSPFGGTPAQPQDQGDSSGSSATKKLKVGSGSGFFVSADGLIVTNKHVVADEQADYTVILHDGSEHVAKVLARDPSNDIAVIKIDGKDYSVSPIGDSDKIRVGETVIAIGNPLGEFENSVTRGIVSGLKRSLDAGSGMSGDSEHLSGIIQIDAAINPGNSGGPLFNLAGEVIGINVAMAQGAESIGFSLPINQVKRIVEQVRTTGKLSFPYLGVRAMILTDDLKKKTQLPYNYGALVLRGDTLTDFAVVPGSPADKAGIVENDILLEINGQKIDSDHSLVSLIGQNSVGDTIKVKVWHKGETKDISVRLEERKQ